MLSPTYGLRQIARGTRGALDKLLASNGARRNLLALFDQGVVSAASFGTAMILGRFGSREELGIYALALTLLMLIVNIQGELITAPYILFRQRRDAADVPAYTGSVLLHELVAVMFAMLVFTLFAVASALHVAPRALLEPMCVLAFAGPFWMLRAFIRFISFANLQFGKALVVDAFAAVVQLAVLLYLLWSEQLNAATTYAAMGAACAIAATTWWFACRLPLRIEYKRAFRDFKENWTFSRWALASQIVGCMTPYVLPWLLAHARGAADTGTFAACTNLCGIATMFVIGLAHALTPQAAQAFATGGKPALVRLLTRTTGLFIAGTGTFCIVMLFAGELAMTTIYGPSFTSTHETVTLLAFGVLANSLAIITGNGLWAVNRPQANLIADATVLIVTLISALLLVAPLGTVGAAAATLLGSSAGAIVRALIFRRVLREVTAPTVAAS